MRKTLAQVSNLLELSKAFKTLADETTAEPHMGLIHGFTGSGKTTSIAWLLNRLPDISSYNGAYVRAFAVWSVSTMLRSIITELGTEPQYRSARNVEIVCQHIAERKVALFIDEADYLFDGRDKRMLETLRDIHDATGLPVIFIGMDGIERKLGAHRQLDRRVTQRVKFQPLEIADAQLVADNCCEVKISTDLVERLHGWSKGSIALCVVALTEIERVAKLQRLESVDANWWGDREFRRGA